ncbi:hypothetical protein GCM10027612_36420 [Microbispora bryophytorum subsp. camponoti]
MVVALAEDDGVADVLDRQLALQRDRSAKGDLHRRVVTAPVSVPARVPAIQPPLAVPSGPRKRFGTVRTVCSPAAAVI